MREPTKQTGARLPASLYDVLGMIENETRIRKGDIFEASLLFALGSKDSLVLAKRQKLVECIKTFRERGEKLPFEHPLALQESDAHNGIVGVAGSNPADSTSMDLDVQSDSTAFGKHGQQFFRPEIFRPPGNDVATSDRNSDNGKKKR